MIPFDLHFAEPFWALLFIPTAFIFFYLVWKQREREERLSSYYQLEESIWLRLCCFFAAVIFGIFALMQPVGNAQYETGSSYAKRVLLLMDSSASMELTDTRSEHSRFQVAKEVAEELTQKLRGATVGLYSFTRAVQELSPPTMDLLFVQMMIQQMGIDDPGAPGTNLTVALDSLAGEGAVVLLTDGGDEMTASLAESAKNISQLFIVGIGSKEGAKIPGTDHVAKLQESFLRSIASSGYFSTEDRSTAEIAASIAEGLEFQHVKGELIYHDYFFLPLFFSMLFLGAALLLPERGVL